MRTVIYFVNQNAPLYIESYLPEQLVKAFKACNIDAYVMPHHLLPQAS